MIITIWKNEAETLKMMFVAFDIYLFFLFFLYF